MNWFDLAIVGVILLFALIGIVRGFIKEVLSLASWIFSFWLAFTFAENASHLLANQIDTPVLRVIAAFAALFVVSLLLLTIISYLIHKLICVRGIRGTDRALGGIFGAAKGLVIVAALMLFAQETVLPQEPWWRASVFAGSIEPVVIVLKDLLPAEFANRLQPAAV